MKSSWRIFKYQINHKWPKKAFIWRYAIKWEGNEINFREDHDWREGKAQSNYKCINRATTVSGERKCTPSSLWSYRPPLDPFPQHDIPEVCTDPVLAVTNNLIFPSSSNSSSRILIKNGATYETCCHFNCTVQKRFPLSVSNLMASTSLDFAFCSIAMNKSFLTTARNSHSATHTQYFITPSSYSQIREKIHSSISRVLIGWVFWFLFVSPWVFFCRGWKAHICQAVCNCF